MTVKYGDYVNSLVANNVTDNIGKPVVSFLTKYLLANIFPRLTRT
jgi:hypothetical protein